MEAVTPQAATELAQAADKLWERIADTKDKKERKALVDEYNAIAKQYNEQVGRDDLTIITSKTVVTKAADIPEPEAQPEQPKPKAKPAPAAKKKTAAAPAAAATERTVSNPPAVAGEPKPGSVIAQILELHKKGLSNKEIIAQGFNKSTVNRQVNEYKKRKANGNK